MFQFVFKCNGAGTYIFPWDSLLVPVSPDCKKGGRGGGIILPWPSSLCKCIIIKVAGCSKIYIFLFLEYSVFW